MFYRNEPVWDLTVENRNGQLALVVEVKGKTSVSPEWAAKFRLNLLHRSNLPKAPYFLMVFPDKFYLWTDANLNGSEPNFIIDASLILQPYFKRAGVKGEQVSEQSLELIISSWLGEIIHSDKLPENSDGSQQWLIDSGLYTALAGGKFQYEAVA